MRIILFLLVVIFLMSCEREDLTENALVEYTCTKEQMEKVHYEANWCNKNTDYFSGYCYRLAIMRNCDKKEKK